MPEGVAFDPAIGLGTVFAADPLFAGITGAGLGLNGITFSTNGTALIVSRFIPAAVL